MFIFPKSNDFEARAELFALKKKVSNLWSNLLKRYLICFLSTNTFKNSSQNSSKLYIPHKWTSCCIFFFWWKERLFFKLPVCGLPMPSLWELHITSCGVIWKMLFYLCWPQRYICKHFFSSTLSLGVNRSES